MVSPRYSANTSGSVRLYAALLATLVAAAVLLALAFTMRPPARHPVHAFHGTAYPEAEPAPEFALTDHRGAEVRLADFRGAPVLLFFGFVNCPDVCPLTLTRLRHALEQIGPRARDVNVLLVTVDPERDTPAVLAEYVARFGPQVSGLTGEPGMLEQMRRAYGVYAEQQPGHDGHRMIVHTTAVFGIDGQSRLRVLLRADGPAEELQSDIRRLLSL